MSHNKCRSRSSPMTAVLAVILLLAGVAAIGASLWMQETEITSGVEAYEVLSQQLKLPTVTEEALYKQPPNVTEVPKQDESPEQTPDELPETEEPILKQPAEGTAKSSVTIVSPLPVTTDAPAIQGTASNAQPVIHKPFNSNLGYTGQISPPAKPSTAISSVGCRFPARMWIIPWY